MCELRSHKYESESHLNHCRVKLTIAIGTIVACAHESNVRSEKKKWLHLSRYSYYCNFHICNRLCVLYAMETLGKKINTESERQISGTSRMFFLIALDTLHYVYLIRIRKK